MTYSLRVPFHAGFRSAHIVACACFLSISLFLSNIQLRASEDDHLREAIYRHNKVVLDINRDKYGVRYQPEDYVIDNKYRFALVDLNDDKIADAIVFFDSLESCGTGGCILEIYRGTKRGFEFLSGSTITLPPIRVTSEKRYGWKTLIVLTGGTGDVLLRFNGSRYPLNPSLQPKAIQSQINSAITVLDQKK
jgi:hypothetical protein